MQGFRELPVGRAPLRHHCEDAGDLQPIQTTTARTLETCLSELLEPIETTADGSDLEASLERRRHRALPAAAALVKDLQRRRPGSRLRWAAHCVAHSDGVKDPGRHTFDSVSQFLVGELPFLKTLDADYWAIISCFAS